MRFALTGVLLALAVVSARAQDYSTGYLFASSGSVSGNVGVGTNAAAVLLDARGGNIEIEQSMVEVFLASATQTSALSTGGAQVWTAVPGVSSKFTLARTMTVRMHARGSANSAASSYCGVAFIVDGVQQGNVTWGNAIFYAAGYWLSFSTQLEVSLGAGTHTIATDMNSNTASGGCLNDGNTYGNVQMWIYGR